MNKTILSAVLMTLLVTGCASQDANVEQAQLNTTSKIPAWVMNPASANGFSASNCVKSSGNFAIDRNHAISLSRTTLAQNMELKASVLEKTFQKLDDSAGLVTAGSSFEQIAKQVTSVSLQKSQVEQVAVIKINNIDQVCALVTIPKAVTSALFNESVGQNSNIVPTDKAALYKEFISQKTTKELESQVKSL